MKLLEYEAKSLLAAADVAVPTSILIPGDQTPSLPVVLKSQVPTGGRGKAGGIVVAKTIADYDKAAKQLLTLPIKGFLPKHLLAEELLSIDKEFYISILIDKSRAAIVLMAQINGGVEVEENSADDFLTLVLSPDSFDQVGETLAEYFDLPEKTFVLQELVGKLYNCFCQNDALLLEINPLVLTREGRLVAGDCKMECDDSTSFRHPEWSFEVGETESNFVTLDEQGNVATIANGAGLAMATVDAVADAGLRPANFLDIGGGATAESILAAFERITEYQQVRAIVINIFAGITRCDEVAKAIIAARQQIEQLPPLSIRLAGTNFEAAAELLAAESIPVLQTLEECITNAKKDATS